jgi:hypothetical protein
MSEFDWHSFLRRWSQDYIRFEDLPVGINQQMVENQWFGYEGASEVDIIELEERIGKQLPPSFRNFLKVTNGWTQTIYGTNIASTYDIGWFKDLNADWIRLHQEAFEGLDDVQDLPDMNLQHTLQIGIIIDNAVLLLNPNAVNEDGEWEAWFFATWGGGVDVHPSFQALMFNSYENFLMNNERELTRYHTGDNLLEKIENLEDEFMAQMAIYAKMSRLDFGVSEMTRAVLQDILVHIREIRQNTTSSSVALEVLKSLRAEFNRKASEKPSHVDTTEMLSVLTATNPEEAIQKLTKLAPDLMEKGRERGFQVAAETINWFLKDH